MSNTTLTNNVTRIDLYASTFAREYSKEELIHKKEFEKVMRLIKKQLDDVEKTQPSTFVPPRYHNTISIFGSRGTGKTSFLYSVLSELKKEEKERVEILGFLDPTLIEEKEHIFLLVVSLINSKVCKKLKEAECGLDTKSYRQSQEWEKSLKQLAKGLPTLEKVGEDHRNAHWQNQDFIMERGLEEVNAAFTLEKHFHQLVEIALKILGKKAFVLALDDIDVNMRKGEDVLEMIRKYITTPKMITLLSGNYKLYSLNVRRLQWEQIKENNKYESEMDYTTMVNELEGQYMMKVLKPENRIRLYTLFDTITFFKHNYGLTYFGGKENIRIEEAYSTVLRKWGICGKTQFDHFCNYLLGVSFRSQVHFLINNEQETQSVLESIEAFLSRLYAAKVNVDLAVSRADMLDIVIQQYLQLMEFSPDNYLLTPNMDDDNVNACFTAFTIMFAKQVKTNPFLLFDYAVRIGFTRNLLLRIDQDKEFYFYRHVGLNQNVSLRNCVGLSLGYVYEDALTYSIILKGLDAKSKTKDKEGRIDFELSKGEINVATKVVAYLPVLLIAKNNDTLVNVSLYSLLAVISDILRRSQSPESIEELLLSFSQLRVYPIFSKQGQNQSKTADDYRLQSSSIENLKAQDGDNSLTELADAIWMWKHTFNQTVPPYLIGKIMTRLDRAVQQISQPLMGKYMHRCVVALLNASLVEEFLENYEIEKVKEGISRLNLNNVVTDDKLFNSNLDFIKRNKADEFIPITKWLMNCPLFLPFLSNQMVSSSGFKDMLSEQAYIGKDTVYEVICKVKRNTKIDGTVKLKFSGSMEKFDEMKKYIEDQALDFDMIVKVNEQEALRILNESDIFSNKININSVKAFQRNARRNVAI